MLNDFVEFLPYGAAMKADGEVVAVGATTDSEHPPSAELVKILKDGFRTGAARGDYKATSLFYDVLYADETAGRKKDAVAAALDHIDGYSAIVFYPYEILAGKVAFGELFASRETDEIFYRWNS